MPKFEEFSKEDLEVSTEIVASWEEKLDAYLTLSEECIRVLSFIEICETRYRGHRRGVQRLPYHNLELKNSINKITVAYFDGTSMCAMSSWIQKLDTYFQLNPMAERDSINLVPLHLDGESIDWWFHGMNTLGHD